ncbi:MAG: hypothetical protein AAB885_02730 [Patescibacteria group bacterium]
MKKIQKLSVNKSDEPALVVEKIIDSDADEIILSIPRFSKLADSLANFHLIKREAEFLQKKIIIESVDDKAIELASLAKLEALNPFFIRSRRQFSDIVVGQKKTSRGKTGEVIEGLVEPIIEPIRKKRDSQESGFAGSDNASRMNLSGFKKLSPRLPTIKKTTFIALASVGLGVFLFLAVKVLPKAEILIITQKEPWIYNNSVVVDKLAVGIDPISSKIPGQIFSLKQNLQLSFPASAKKIVEEKASGKITIYNAYSSSPQKLVSTTRFLTPDGKLFRLSEEITVPEAQIIEGRIVPSSIETIVTADKAGESFNIGPVSKFTIPGFKGTPKYNAFYGESKAPMTGGFIGEVVFPSDADLKKAKSELVDKLEKTLLADISKQIPSGFKSINGSNEVVFGKPVVNTSVNTEGNFTVSGEASIEQMAFKDDDLKDLMIRKIKRDKGENFGIKSFEISYGQARTDFGRDLMSFPIDFKAQIVRTVNIDELRQKLANKNENDLKALLFAVPGLESAQISLWPFWVKKSPSDIGRINIAVD